MLRNYFKMALKVLLRNKFYTFISMFGISFTLAILLIVTALWEHTTGQQAPEVNLDRSLVVFRMRLELKNGGNWGAGSSYYFLDRYVKNLKTPEKMTFYSLPSTVSIFLEDKKIDLEQKYTDAAFWDIMQFKFLEGRSYSEEEIARAQKIAVISHSLKEQMFGQESALGKEVKLGNERYQVIGVVNNVSFSRIHTTGDLYLPYSLGKGYLKDKSYLGDYAATLVAKNPAARKEVQKEYAAMMKHVQNPDPQLFSAVHSHADTYLEAYTRMFLGNSESSGVIKLYVILGVIMFLFVLLPTVNLVNINISRTLERSSEIGARKAFGASSATLVGQFVIENLVLTFICGVLALIIAGLAIEGINSSQLIKNIDLALNYDVLLKGLFFTLVFGLLSGVFPAWRMSCLQASEALKGR